MSDSDTSTRPSDAAISRSLRDVVVSLYKAGNTDELTVKRVRARTEDALGLPTGFLKTDSLWKQKSSDVIKDAVDKYCNDDAVPEPAAKTPKAKPSPKTHKRKAVVPAKKPLKRAKTTVSPDEESDAAPGAQEEFPSVVKSVPKGRAVGRARKVVEEDPEDPADEPVRSATPPKKPKTDAVEEEKASGSEGDLSSLLDESPVKKKRQKQSPSTKRGKGKEPKAKPTAKSTKSKAGQDDDPDTAEIKRLQGWLLKCGIRRIWTRELSKYDTPKDKIGHLQNMLKDAGMEGKYSVEKAAKIKQERELAKEIEAIREGERQWGKAEEPADGGRPKRRAARAAPKVVLEDLEDDDEDESDDAHDPEDKEAGQGSADDDTGHSSADEDEGDSE